MKSIKKKRLIKKKLKTKKIRKKAGARANPRSELELKPIDIKPITELSLNKILIPVPKQPRYDDYMKIYHRFLGINPKCPTFQIYSVGFNIMKYILSNKIGYIYIGNEGIENERELLVISSLNFTKDNPLLLNPKLLQTLSLGGWRKQQQCLINRDYEKILCNENINAEAILIENIGIPSEGFHYILKLKLSGKTQDSNNQYRKDNDDNPIIIYCDSTMYSERKFKFDENNGLTYTKTYPGYIVMFISLEKDETELKKIMKDWYSHLTYKFED